MSDAIADAVKAEMLAVLGEGKLTPSMCSTLMRLAESGRELLRARSKKPEDFEGGTTHAGEGDLPAVNAETFGVKMFREVLPMLKELRPQPQPLKEDPEQLVRALAQARILGLADVVKALEEKLGLPSKVPIAPLACAAETRRHHFGKSVFVTCELDAGHTGMHQATYQDDRLLWREPFSVGNTVEIPPPGPPSGPPIVGTVRAVAVDVEAPSLKSTHRCRICSAHWHLWSDGTWSLMNDEQKPRQCCDNASDFKERLELIWSSESAVSP